MRQTNFDLLRCIGVGIVVFGNGLLLTGAPIPGLWGAPLPRVGLDVLFAVAGFGAAQSVRIQPAVRFPAVRFPALRFMARQIGQVLPLLVVSVLLTALVIGPFATSLSARDYLLARDTRRFLLNMLLLPHPFLPGAFAGQQWSGAANPMIWAITASLAFCAILLPLHRLPAAWRSPAALLGGTLGGLLALLWPSLTPGLPRVLLRPEFAQAVAELPFFLIAAALGFAGRGDRPCGAGLWRADLACAGFALTWVAATWLGAAAILVEWFTLPYMVACFGRMSLVPAGVAAWLGRWAIGVFLLAFPLQQLIVAQGIRARGIMPLDPILACFGLAAVAGVIVVVGADGIARGWARWRGGR